MLKDVLVAITLYASLQTEADDLEEPLQEVVDKVKEVADDYLPFPVGDVTGKVVGGKGVDPETGDLIPIVFESNCEEVSAN